MNNISTSPKSSINETDIQLWNKEELLSLSDDEKIKHLKEFRVGYPKFEKMLQAVEECHQSTNYTGLPTCMRISGPSGSGKTAIAEAHKEIYPDYKTESGDIKPVLYLEVPCPAYIGSLPIKLLNTLNDPFWDKRGKIVWQTERVYSLLKDCQVRIIFLDEVQHLVDRNKRTLIKDSSDWFKQLISETKISVVFMGMPESSKIFIENEQLNSRVRLVETINPFEFDDTFKKVLYAFDKNLPLKDYSDLAEPEISKRIYIATQGLMRNIQDLMIECTKIALKTRSTRITLHILAKAFDKILFTQYKTNPFYDEFDITRAFKEYLSKKESLNSY